MSDGAGEMPFNVIGGPAGPVDRPATGITYRINWSEYWLAFCKAHGEPVPFEGRLLFADGWTYSSSDHAGPEWPPPDDKERLRFMQWSYWNKRRYIVRTELEGLRDQAENLARLQEIKNIPLCGEIGYIDPTGKAIVEKVQGVVDFSARIKWLSDDLVDCERRLKEFEHPKDQSQDGRLSARVAAGN